MIEGLRSVRLDGAADGTNAYRGERLELEILPFREHLFASFFDTPDAIASKLPVEELIERVAERYAAPSNAQLRARLLMAAAFQRAFSEAVEKLGTASTGILLGWFRQLHFLFMDLHNHSDSESGQPILELLRTRYSRGDDFRDLTEWLFDLESWQRFPADLAARFLEGKLRSQSSPNAS